MRSRATRSLLLAGWLLGAPALAHEGGTHARGTVQEVAADRIVLRTTEGKLLSLPLTTRTRCLRGAREIQPSEIKPGERAVVHAASREGKLEAAEVRVAGG
jgi:hypothetical protein